MSYTKFPLFVTTLAGSGIPGYKDGLPENSQFNGPIGVSVDPRNTTNLYVADRDNHCIRIINTLDGSVSTFSGTCKYKGYLNGPSKSSKFNNPIAVLAYFDSVIVSDTFNFRLRKISSDGIVTTFSGSGVQGRLDGDYLTAQFGYPCGMDLDESNGNIIVAEGSFQTVRQVTSNGSVTTIAGSGETGSEDGPALLATFNWISDVKYFNGSIYIADSMSSLIRKLENGIVSIYAGKYPGYKDGPLSVALFNNGNGLTFDRDGALIFTDLTNGLIRMIANETMSTIAGIRDQNENLDGLALKSTFKAPSILDIDLKENVLYIPNLHSHNIKMVCAAPCYNGGIYNCLKKTCTCSGKWLGPYCLSRTLSTKTTVATSFPIVDSTSYYSTVVSSDLSATTVIAISISFAVLLIISLLGIFLYQRQKLAQRKLESINTSTTKYVSVLDRNSKSKAKDTFSIASGLLDKGLTMTRTFTTTASVVSIPGYCMLDIDNDLNMNNEAKLGEGGTAIIYKCTFSRASLIAKYRFNEVALKIIKANDEQSIAMIKFEIAILSNIPPQQNVIHFVGYSETPLAIVMKYYPLSLKDMLLTDTNFSNELQLKIAIDIASGMSHIHGNEILHLDLKPHNVLLDVQDDGTFNCVICDFGFANFIKGTKQSVAGISTQSSLGITPKYAAPEMISSIEVRTTRFDEEIHKKIDVYAFAIILFELISRKSAWDGKSHQEICDAVLAGNRPHLQNPSNPILEKLINQCWLQSPSERPAFDVILSTIHEEFSLLSQFTSSDQRSMSFSVNTKIMLK